MKRLAVLTLLALVLPGVVHSRIYPQFGIESYIGPNRVFSISPWVAARFPLSSETSFIIKYYDRNLSYLYQDSDGSDLKRIAHLFNLAAIFYFQKNGFDFYSAVSGFTGTDGYQALVLDSGLEFHLLNKLSLEGGFYFQSEDSILWYPDEPNRGIQLAQVRTGIKYLVLKSLKLHGELLWAKNSEEVRSFTIYLGLIYSPRYPFDITLYYFHYSETSQYRFGGNYLAVGLDCYF